MTKPVILTPCHDGMYHANYVRGLVGSILAGVVRGWLPTELESHIDRARSKQLCFSLKRDELKNEKFILKADADVGWHPTDVVRIMSLPDDLDIVAGVYPKKNGGTDAVYRGPMGEEHPQHRDVVGVKGVGFGFVRIRREVIDHIDSKSRRARGGWRNIFKSGFPYEHDDEWLSEDYYFCEEAAQLGYKTWLDRAIRLTHRGNTETAA